jgi:transglutaminase-like putative cysteine protease
MNPVVSKTSSLRILVGVALVAAAILLMRKPFKQDTPITPPSGQWTISVSRTVRVEPAAGTSSYRIRYLRFPNLPHQTVLEESLVPAPNDSGVDPAGAWIGWTITNPNGSMEYTLRTVLEVANNDLSSPPSSTNASASLDEFLGSDTFRQLQDPSIRSMAQSIEAPDTLATLSAIWTQVLARLRYGGVDPFDRSAAYAARTGTGDCSEFSDLFVALARSCGIPARRMNGWTFSGHPNQRHAWVEAWIPSRGWTAFDPTWGRNGNATFEHIPAPRAAIGWNPPGPQMEHQPYESWRWWGDSPVFSHRDTVIASRSAK